MSEKQWIPLESNPEVLTRFAHALGLSSLLTFTDVWSLDLIDVVPAPCHAVLLLLPLTDKILSIPRIPPSSKRFPYFCKQTIGNACGTIAVLHAVLNSQHSAAPLVQDSFLARFYARTLDMTPEQRAEALQADDGLDAVHDEFAQMGQTDAPRPDEKVGLHFVAFVQHEGTLFELDGRMDHPIDHGACDRGVLHDAAAIIQSRYMAADPAEMRFTIMALTAAA